MGKFEIEFSKKAARHYTGLPQDYKTLIDSALKRLERGRHDHLQPIKGQPDVFRLRVGKYRILFKKFKKTIIIARIGTRGDIYK